MFFVCRAWRDQWPHQSCTCPQLGGARHAMYMFLVDRTPRNPCATTDCDGITAGWYIGNMSTPVLILLLQVVAPPLPHLCPLQVRNVERARHLLRPLVKFCFAFPSAGVHEAIRRRLRERRGRMGRLFPGRGLKTYRRTSRGTVHGVQCDGFEYLQFYSSYDNTRVFGRAANI